MSSELPDGKPCAANCRLESALFADYNYEGYAVRTLFARLEGQDLIDNHGDGLYSLRKCHRIHIMIAAVHRGR